MAHLTGEIFRYTTHVTKERMYTVLKLFQNNDELDHKKSNMTHNEFYDSIARMVELQYIDALSITRTMTGDIFFLNSYITDEGKLFLKNFNNEQEI